MRPRNAAETGDPSGLANSSGAACGGDACPQDAATRTSNTTRTSTLEWRFIAHTPNTAQSRACTAALLRIGIRLDTDSTLLHTLRSLALRQRQSQESASNVEAKHDCTAYRATSGRNSEHRSISFLRGSTMSWHAPVATAFRTDQNKFILARELPA